MRIPRRSFSGGDVCVRVFFACVSLMISCAYVTNGHQHTLIRSMCDPITHDHH